MEVWTVNDFKANDAVKKKQRKRITLTCASCRIRKVKCDQKKPCTACSKKGIPMELCIYEDSPFVGEASSTKTSFQIMKNLRTENSRLKVEIENLKKLISKGPAVAAPTEDTDSNGELYCELYDHVTVCDDRIVYHGATALRTFLSEECENSELNENIKNSISYTRHLWQAQLQNRGAENRNLDSHISSSPESLLESLKNYLPDYKTVESYISLYLSSFWQFSMPLIDPSELVSSFLKIFTKINETEYKLTIVKKSIDYANLTLILVVLKFSIVTINHSALDAKYDAENRILFYIDSLLDLAKAETKATLPTLQTLVLLRQLKNIDSFDGESCSDISTALPLKQAVNMAITMGLHKDVDRLYHNESVAKRKLLKTIWKFLVAEDSIQSFQIGVPLTIEDHEIESYPFNENNYTDAVIIYVREASRILANSRYCKVSDVLSLVKRIENHDNGNLIRLAKDVQYYSAVENISEAYATAALLHFRILAVYLLHVLYQVLLVGLKDKGEDVTFSYFNSSAKYLTLAIAYIIELLLRLNYHILLNAPDTSKLLPLVEISMSAIGNSRFIFFECYHFSFITEMTLLKNLGFRVNNEGLPSPYFVEVQDLENFDPKDRTNIYDRLFRAPAFLHGLMSVGCKYLLKVKEDSYGSVFDVNLFLLIIVSLYKRFDKYFEANLPADQKEALGSISVFVKFNSPVLLCDKEKQNDIGSAATPSIAALLNPHVSGDSVSTIRPTEPASSWVSESQSLLMPSMQDILLEAGTPFVPYNASDLETYDLKGPSIDKLLESVFGDDYKAFDLPPENPE